MLKNKKQLLGLAGLVAVGIMTAIAYTMPTPDAAAIEGAPGYECDNSVEGKECASAGNDVNISVTVTPSTPTADLSVSGIDRNKTINPVIKYSTIYKAVSEIGYKLYYTPFATEEDPNPETVLVSTASFEPTDDANRHEDSFDLEALGYGSKYGTYRLEQSAKGYNGEFLPGDGEVITFNYEAIIAYTSSTTAPNGDPIIDMAVGKEVDKVTIHLYDEKSEPVKDKDGNDLVIEVDPADIDPTTGKVNIRIPFEENELPGGKYTAVVIAQDKDGEVLSMVVLNLEYKPVTPDTPNTGFVLSDLNISRLDYILTGLLAFGLVAAFALYLAFRRNHRA